MLYGKGEGCGPACWLVDALCREGAASSSMAAAAVVMTTRMTAHGTAGLLGDNDAGARTRMPLLGGIALHSAILSLGSGGTLAALT